MTKQERTKRAEPNRDPITGEPGAHPLGVGLGAAGAATAGAIAGSLGGPVTALVGAAVGGVLGGLAGKSTAEAVNPTAEDGYWSQEFSPRLYALPGKSYEGYRAAYRHGWEGADRYGELNWTEAEARLRRDWEQGPHGSSQDWREVSAATREAWDRVRTGADKSDDKG